MLVSVIIPSFNRKEFLRAAVASVLSQSFQDFELIVVEDGTEPDQRFYLEDPRVKIYYQLHRGVSAARNFGVSVSTGKYIAFLDSDDLWMKDKLEKQLHYIYKNPEFKIIHTNEKWLRNGKHLNPMKKHQKYGGWIFEKCLPLCIISCSSILMERALFLELGGFDESLPACEDYDLWLRMTLKYPIAYLDQKLVVKRGGHLDQLSKKYWGMDRFRVQALEKLLKMDLDEGKRVAVMEELERKKAILVAGARKRVNHLIIHP